ncbi:MULTISPECIES: hypothetical protein [Stenotrophomonas]|nr:MULTISPECIES: hypothetical protein [Stenotrophomonas]
MMNFLEDSTAISFTDAEAMEADIAAPSQAVIVGENLIFITRDPE